MIYEFDACVLDTDTQQLWRDGELSHAEPQVLAVLEHLVANAGRVVTKIELLDEVWGDRFVSESALTSRIKLARKACGDSGREQRIIKTVHSRGYRVVADVAERSQRPAAPATHEPPAPSPERTRSVSRSAGSVVGRDDELDELDEAFRSLVGGPRRWVFVTGEAGSGKSAVVAEALERTDELEDWSLARGRCLRTRGAAEPYFCLLDALTHLARVAPDAVREALERVAPSWLAQIPILVDDEVAARLERRLLGSSPQRMLREGADAFRELALDRPLVLVLEDLQWADDCTLDVLDLLLERSEDVPLLVIGTGRTAEGPTEALISSAVRFGRAAELPLAPLAADAVAALVGERFPGVAVPEELVAAVQARCDGIPLFAHEILTAWTREGTVVVRDDALVVEGEAAELAATVPPTLRSLLERSLAELEPDESEVLAAAAVAGTSFDSATVAAGLGRSVGDTDAVLASLARRLSVIGAEGGASWPDGTVSTAYTFTHGLYRDAVLERTPAARQAELHARIGAALAAGYASRPGEIAVALAEHFVAAGDAPAAVEHLLAAGEQAAARSAHGHAVEFLEQALVWADRLPPGRDRNRSRLDVLLALGSALAATRGWFDESVEQAYEQALALCDPDRPCREGALARYGLATISELHGRFARTEELLSPLLDESPSGDLAMEAHELVACSTFHQGAFAQSVETAGTALDLWDEEAYSDLMARIAEHPASSCNSWVSLATWALGHSDESVARAERAVVLGEENTYALSTAVQQRAMLHQLRGEPAATIEWAERTREVGGEQEFPMRVIQADLYKGWALGASGSPEEGMALIADGLARFRAAGATLNEAYYLGMYADASLRAGHADRALALLDEALATMGSSTRSYFYESELHRLRARALLELGGADAPDAARAELDESLAVTERQGSVALALRTLADRCELEADHGDAGPWLARLGELAERFAGERPTPDLERVRHLLAS